MRDAQASQRFNALIFDMDGVLADTEPLHVRAWTSTLREIDPLGCSSGTVEALQWLRS